MESNKKNVILLVIVLFIGLIVSGGTYAFLTLGINVKNGNYAAMSHCFQVDYNINNIDGTKDITGTMFPSSSASGGLNGRVGLKINDSCELYGTGTLKLHINNTTNTKLTTPATSYCESRKTLEKIDGITTEAACKDENVNGRWRGYADSYCEKPSTLERLTSYTTESDCTSNGGSWKSGGSPLKYAVYNTTDIIQTPIKVGHITSNDIGKDIVLKDDISIIKEQKYFYIYVWLDGYLTDGTYTELPFSGYISAEAVQNNNIIPSTYQRVEYLKSTGTQYIDTGLKGYYGFDIDFQVTQDTPDDTSYFFGHRQSGLDYRFALVKYKNIFHLMTGAGSTWNNSFDMNRHYVQLRYDVTSVDGQNWNKNWGTGGVGLEYSFYLFAANFYGDVKSNNGMKIYTAKFYENDEKLVRDFIPCYNKNTGIRGLYDIVTDEFYINSGTDTFEIGPEI